MECLNRLKGRIIIDIREVLYDKYIITLDGSDPVDFELYFDDHTQCCESAGFYIQPSDNLKDFIGATIEEISIYDDDEADLGFEVRHSLYAESVTFVTSKGDLTFTCYNDHNGYYAHDMSIKINGLLVYDVSI